MPLPIFLPCAAGVETLLAEEVMRILPGVHLDVVRAGVALQGNPLEVMTLNLECRLPQRVLVEVAEGPYHDEHNLYELGLTVDWQQWITPQHTLRVDTTAQRSPLKSLNFAALKIKDAVCDQLRDATGERPNVDTQHPDLQLILHLGPERAALYIDTSGEPLFKRGWREDKGDAPLKETLAAAMLAAAGWRGTPAEGGALHDPCCGSGTIAIEAAQIACDIAPGLQRRFAFERLLPFMTPDLRAQWQRLKSHAQSRIRPSAVPIFASDVAFRMVDFARRNAERAGVANAITFNGGDALERPAPAIDVALPGTLMLNPPYGERIEVAGKAGPGARGGDRAAQAPRGASHAEPAPRTANRFAATAKNFDRTDPTERPSSSAASSSGAGASDGNRHLSTDFFARLASHWKQAYTQHPAGWTAFVLSPDMKLPSAMRLKESRRTPMWNGPIECRLFRFDLVAGAHR